MIVAVETFHLLSQSYWRVGEHRNNNICKERVKTPGVGDAPNPQMYEK